MVRDGCKLSRHRVDIRTATVQPRRYTLCMHEPRPIRGILFDSGDTLVQPLGGAWFLGHQFREILRRHNKENIAWERLEAAIAAGAGYLDTHHALLDEEEERRQFAEFYRLALAKLGVLAPDPGLLVTLAAAIVDDPNFAFFADVAPALADLRARGCGLVSFRTRGRRWSASTRCSVRGNSSTRS
jgi:hypothetical protein